MAYAAHNSYDILGCFIEKEYNRPFEYKLNSEEVFAPDFKTGKNIYFRHLVFVGPRGDETRMALVKKTVAYVVVDEFVHPERGSTFFRIEKWNIKKHRKYSR
jgi:hypothetical protein